MYSELNLAVVPMLRFSLVQHSALCFPAFFVSYNHIFDRSLHVLHCFRMYSDVTSVRNSFKFLLFVEDGLDTYMNVVLKLFKYI
jgi:hypothetical protein